MSFVPTRGFLNKGIMYEQSGQQKLVPFIKDNARQFFTDQMGLSARQSLFKSLLAHQITQGVHSIESQLKKSIVVEFPFVFGAETLPLQMRYLIYSIKQGYDFANLQPEWFKNMNSQAFNSTVEQAIYESLKFQKPYLASAYDKYQQIRKYLLQPGDKNADRRSMRQLQVTKNSIWDRAKAIGLGIGAFMYNTLTRLDKRIFMDGKSLEFFRDTIMKAKIYGSIVINCAYLERYGVKQVHDGIIVIFDPIYPQLRFQISNSKVVIYIERNGQFKQIPEQIFTLQFLRGLLKQQFTSRAGKVLKKYNEMVDSDIKNAQNKNDFQSYFYVEPRNPLRGLKPYKKF